MEMKPYFLVQRIKPARGYPKAGIPGLARYFLDSKRKLKQALKESLDALQDIIPLDYMGSAEFEFGSVPQCLSEIVERRAELAPFAVDITGTPDFYATAAEQPALHEEASKHKQKVRLEGWCLKGDEKNLADFIRKQAAGKIDQLPVEGADRHASRVLRDRSLPVCQRQAAKESQTRIPSARVERLDGFELPLVRQQEPPTDSGTQAPAGNQTLNTKQHEENIPHNGNRPKSGKHQPFLPGRLIRQSLPGLAGRKVRRLGCEFLLRPPRVHLAERHQNELLPVPIDKAKSVYDKIVGEKIAKGYTPAEGGQPYVASENAGRVSGLLPQLLNMVDDEGLARLIMNTTHCAQEKFDGRRTLVQKNSIVEGANKKGLLIALPLPIQVTVRRHRVGARRGG